MRAILAITCAVWCGCISDRLVDCEGGYACPQGLVCDDVHHGCVDQQQLDACAGDADTTPCTAGAIAGTCSAGVCLAPSCGNYVVDPGEQCDDGNHVSGDGCSADCRSTETCGNGLIDTALGEQCDDGNLISHDGCDSRCQSETEKWTTIPIGIVDASWYRAAFDASRGVLVYADRTATWEWDGTAWTVPGYSAPVVDWSAVVYDSDLQRVVGIGNVGSPLRAATWDGTAWTLIPALTGSVPTVISAATYDAARHAILVLGDSTAAAYLNTTTGAMTKVANVTVGTDVPRLAFDAGRARDVLLDDASANTLEFDGTTWTNVKAQPPANSGWGLTYDGTRAKVVAVGGTLGGVDNGGVYAWDGAIWSNTGAVIPPHTGVAAWYDARDGSIGVFGGTEAGSPAIGEVLSISGTQVVDHTPPGPPSAGLLFYDSVRHHLGLVLRLFTPSTWIYDGGWQPVVSAQAPTVTSTGAFDPVRGGLVAIQPSDDSTWLLTDHWERLALDPPMFPLSGVATYDYAQRRIVLVGANTQVLASDGTAWVAINDGLAGVTAVTYDPGTGNVVTLSVDGLSDLVVDDFQPGAGPPAGYGLLGSFARGSLLMPPVGSGAGLEVFERRHGAVTTFVQTPISLFGVVAVDSPTGVEMSDGKFVFEMSTGTNWLFIHEFVSADPDETCEPGADADGDGLSGCADPDCWESCWPACPYATSCS